MFLFKTLLASTISALMGIVIIFSPNPIMAAVGCIFVGVALFGAYLLATGKLDYDPK